MNMDNIFFRQGGYQGHSQAFTTRDVPENFERR